MKNYVAILFQVPKDKKDIIESIEKLKNINLYEKTMY